MIRLLRRGFTARSVTLVACETVLIVAAVGLAAFLRLGDRAWDVIAFEDGLPKALLIALTVQVCLFSANLYELRSLSDRGALFTRSLHLLLVSRARHRTRGLHHRRGARRPAGHRLASRLRVGQPADRPARAHAARGPHAGHHQPGGGDQEPSS